MNGDYRGVVAGNIRAARARLGITQSGLCERMRMLGFTAWQHQTVTSVEKGRRRVMAEEVLGLALALETSIPALLGADDPLGIITLPGGQQITGASVRRLAGDGRRLAAWDDVVRAVSPTR